MAKETLHMKVGSNLGEILLDIAQNKIMNGDVEAAISTYTDSLCGFTKEYALMCLKNKTVLITDDDSGGVSLSDDPELLKDNERHITDWDWYFNKKLEDIKNIRKRLAEVEKEFFKCYRGDIEDYSIIEMMERYFSHEELKQIGIHNIAARILGSFDGKICDKGSSNPTSIWENLEGKFECYDDEPDATKYEKVLFYTVQYNKLMKMLHKDYVKFEPLYYFLIENDFIARPNKIELILENTVATLLKFADTSKGYYHPLCNTGLYDYKEHLSTDILNTRIGNMYAKEGIIQKDIMDGYDAGWLSPDGEFYGADGETSAMIHMNLADKIFGAPTNKYAVQMARDNVDMFGGNNGPDYWLEKHGWIKIHHNDIYGSFIGRKGDTPTKEFPYAYCPTKIQIKMICDYADKFYNGKFYTEANALGRTYHKDPFSTYAVRQMDEIKLHEIFGFVF